MQEFRTKPRSKLKTRPAMTKQEIEGLMVDRDVTMADLKTVLRLFAQSYLGEDVRIRFRPSFFPFTEPSVEVDMLWHGGDRFVEMGGAGMVDPNVLRAVGYDLANADLRSVNAEIEFLLREALKARGARIEDADENAES